MLLVSACGRGGRPTEDVLPGGIPARTDLHRASSLPPQAIRTVARRDFGWRVIYHPGSAPANADQQAAVALCRLENRRVDRIEHVASAAPGDDPGTRLIDIFCG
ncbi:hypothetical protein ACFSCT_09630 [Paracoccus pacificus]|uniref:Uncharacterized protein n=1 Tax=Paracoccus pacificus TaxID=1463598 RepID=A0ABW4R6T0_9RHOB